MVTEMDDAIALQYEAASFQKVLSPDVFDISTESALLEKLLSQRWLFVRDALSLETLRNIRASSMQMFDLVEKQRANAIAEVESSVPFDDQFVESGICYFDQLIDFDKDVSTLEQLVSNSPLSLLLNELMEHDLQISEPVVRYVTEKDERRIHHQDARNPDGRDFMFTVWIPLHEDSKVCNVDTIGLSWLKHPLDKRYACYPGDDVVQHYDWQKAIDDTSVEIATSYIAPEIKFGDAVIFSSLQPHATYFPKYERGSRASLDFRVTTSDGKRTSKAIACNYPDLSSPDVFTDVPGQTEYMTKRLEEDITK